MQHQMCCIGTHDSIASRPTDHNVYIKTNHHSLYWNSFEERNMLIFAHLIIQCDLGQPDE